MKCPSVISVISQHAEEAAFLWHLRSLAVHQPHYALKDLRKLDLRVEAHLDGLRIAGDHGWETCREALAIGEPGELFAAASLAFESGKPDRIAAVRQAAIDAPANARALASALGWMSWTQAAPLITALFADDSPVIRRAAIAAYSLHRPTDPSPHAPAFHRTLLAALSDSDAPLRARALQAVGELRLSDFASGVERALTDTDPRCRYESARSGAILGIGAAVPTLRRIAESDSEAAADAAALAVRRMSVPEADSWRASLAARPAQRRCPIRAAGALGDPAAVPWLMDQMSDPPLARLAGEAFTCITGADLALLDLEKNAPDDFNAGPTEDAEDQNVSLDPDDHLPWPDPARMRSWWKINSFRFASGTRHLLGAPMDQVCLLHALKTGRQRQRSSAAVELAMRRLTQCLIETRTRADRQ